VIDINKCFKKLCKDFKIVKDESCSFPWDIGFMDSRQDAIAERYRDSWRPTASSSTSTEYMNVYNYSTTSASYPF